MLIKLTDRIYYMPHSEETDRPILGYIRGDKFTLMVDSGNSQKHVELFTDDILELEMPYPDFVAITHSHWDHTYGMSSLKATSIACNKTNEYLENMLNWEWTDEAMKKRLATGEDIEFCDTMIRREYPNLSEIQVKTADIEFNEILKIDLGGITCELMRLESSHADDCVVVYVPEEKIIFIGDIISEDFHHGESKYYKEKLESLINNFKAIDFNIALFGHMEPFSKQELLTWLDETYCENFIL
jgi:glyoxylase-like metal-dependent hydrolase (beta-lactamase superfamily II)